MKKLKRTKISELLKSKDFGSQINVKGWVRTKRGSKSINFIALNDGSIIHNIQIVVDVENFALIIKSVSFAFCMILGAVSFHMT